MFRNWGSGHASVHFEFSTWGCATGRLLERLAQAGALQLCGTDLAPRILEVAAEKLSKTGIPVDLRTADAEDRLPWEGDFFDVVKLTGVLHHFFRPKDALRLKASSHSDL